MRVVIAEDAVLLRAGLERLLAEGDFEVVAAVGDGPALIAAAAALRPDIAIVDVRMPPTHTDEGLRAALEVRRPTPTRDCARRWRSAGWCRRPPSWCSPSTSRSATRWS